MAHEVNIITKLWILFFFLAIINLINEHFILGMIMVLIGSITWIIDLMFVTRITKE